MDYNIIEFKPLEVDDEFWEKYFEFVETNFKHHNPNDPLPDRESVKKRQKAAVSEFYTKRWLAITPEDKVVGWAGFGCLTEESSEYKENKHLANINIAVLADYVRKGLGTNLLKEIVKEARELKRTVLEVGTNNDAGKAFLEHYGAQLTLEGIENRLNIEDINWELMQSWIDDGQKRAEGVSIEAFSTVCPEEILNEFAELYNEALNMAPSGDTERVSKIDGKIRRQMEQQLEDRGYLNRTMITKEKDGRISGMTEILYNPREGYRILQELTGVRPEFRGRGLGKWLKAQMLLYIKETYPEAEFIVTGNAETNAPMLSINERIGFKKHRGSDMYKIMTEDAAKLLGV